MTRRVEFDSGPLGGATLRVALDADGELPGVVWTDEGDYPVTYVLNDRGGSVTYDYVGEAWADERRRCPYVDGNAV